MIVDAFLYAGEKECLEIRVREYEGLVDRHLVMEGTSTFRGADRAVTSLADLHQVSSKIDQAIFTHWAPANPWEREMDQRNAIRDCVTPDDLVLVSDADEIVRRSVLEEAIAAGHRCTAFDLDQFYYRLNLKDEAETVIAARLIRGKDMSKPQHLRKLQPMIHETVVSNAGWHFGWLGDVPRIQEKLWSFAHTELQEMGDASFLGSALKNRFAIHNGHLLTRVDVDASFPIAVRENPGRFQELLA